MQVDNRTNYLMDQSERRLLIKNTIIGFKNLSWELRKKGNSKAFTNLSLLVLIYLKDKNNVSRSDIMKELKSNYNDVENALKLLTQKGFIFIGISQERRLNNKIIVSVKRFKLTLNGEIFVSDFIEKLV